MQREVVTKCRLHKSPPPPARGRACGIFIPGCSLDPKITVISLFKHKKVFLERQRLLHSNKNVGFFSVVSGNVMWGSHGHRAPD